MSGILCVAREYRYKGYFFEWHYYCGPIELKKNGEPKAKSSNQFYTVASEFGKLSDAEKKKYQVTEGGCLQF